MDQERPHIHETPIDIVEHEGEPKTKVWVRRMLLVLLVGLCISFAAPTFGSCSGALGSGGSKLWGTFRVGSRTIDVHESDFTRASQRYAAVFHVLERPRMKDDDVWGQLMLDEAAKAEGIHVSDEQVARFLAMVPRFQSDKKFDKATYESEIRSLAKYMGVDNDGFTAGVRSLLRAQTYESVWLSAYEIPRSREAYEEWKKTNVKLTVEYVTQPFEPLVEQARALPVTDDDIRRAGVLPEVVKMRAIPARRGIEVAYLRVRDVTPERRAALDAFAKEAHLFDATDKEATTESVAWTQFWANCKPGGVYTREAWLALERGDYEKALAEWQKTPEPRDETTKPKDPSDEKWPETPREQFYERWRPFVEAEVLAREALRHMAVRAERESKSFAEVVSSYEQYGVRIVTTPEALSDADLAEKFPEGFGRDSDVEAAVRNQFRFPAPGAQFKPVVSPDPVQAMRLQSRPNDRGWVILRWTSYEPARERELTEIRDQVEAYYRGYRAHDLARDVLAGIRAKVEAAGADPAARVQAFREAAAAAGLDVQKLRRFNQRTERPIPPVLGPTPTPAERNAVSRIAAKGVVLDHYNFLSRLEVGKFEEPILLDDATGAAYLMLLTDKHEPEPIEMDEMTLQIERQRRSSQSIQELMNAISPKELKKRYKLELTEDGRKATEKNDAQE